MAQSQLTRRPPTLLPTAQYRPAEGAFSHRFTVTSSPSRFGTAQARSLFDSAQDEQNGDAAGDAAERREDTVSPARCKPKRERRSVEWVTLVSGLQTKEDGYRLVMVRPVSDHTHTVPPPTVWPTWRARG